MKLNLSSLAAGAVIAIGGIKLVSLVGAMSTAPVLGRMQLTGWAVALCGLVAWLVVDLLAADATLTITAETGTERDVELTP